MTSRNRKQIICLAILSVSLIICSGNAITPDLPAMIKAFSNIPASIVNLSATVQQFAVIITLFISTIMAKKIGMKKTISMGLVLVGLSGIIPLISNSFMLIILSRIILGIGIGFFNSLAIDIINIYYQNDKAQRIKTIGIRTAFEPLGVCVLTMLAGWLATINWHFVFIIYFTAFPVLWFFYHFVPEIHVAPIQSKSASAKSNWKDLFNVSTIILTLMMVFMCIVTAAVSVQVPNIIAQKHLGSSEMASTTISLNTLASMAMGFGFSIVFKRLRRFTLPFGMLFMALGTLIIAMTNNIIILMMGTIIVGFGFPISGSYIYAWIGDAIPKRTQGLITSILLVGCNLGTFISPIVTSLLSRSSVEHAFTIMGIISIVIGMGIAAVQVFHQMKHPYSVA